MKLISYGEHPVTIGEIEIGEDGVKRPLETHLTHRKDQMKQKSIDYCFILQTGIGNKEKDNEYFRNELKKTCHSAKVNKFLVEGQKFRQLSDHYGVEFTLTLPSL